MLLARNEDWVVGLSLRVLLKFCDTVVVCLHSCIDDTEAIVMDIAQNEGANRVIVVGDDKPRWEEMRLRQAMLELARADGATHLWMGDADEILTGNLISDVRGIRSIVETLGRGQILQLPLYNLRGSINGYHANGIWGKRVVSVAFKDDPELGWTGDTFHSREPRLAGISRPPLRPISTTPHDSGGVMHLWGASERRLVAKHRAYKIEEALQWPTKDRREIDRLYSMATNGRPQYNDVPATWIYSAVPEIWWARYGQLMHHLHLDREPWQEKWCDEQIVIHGREPFAGLRL